MLTELRIRNFAIIDALSLRLEPGFNVLSGETGAGKSIIVEALGLLLGERASTDHIRSGAERASVEGVFEIEQRPELRALLEERGVDAADDVLVLKREISAAGRARAWANNGPVTAAVLADIGRHLVNLHGQHEAQALLDADSQRRILDAFGGASEQARIVGEAAAALAEARRERSDLVKRKADAEKRADYLGHVAKEIEEARVVDGEDVRLDEEAKRLEHAGELRSLASGMRGALDGDEDAVIGRLSAVQRSLSHIQRIDPALARLQELFDGGFYALESLATELDRYESSVELDPERLAEVQRRRDLLFRLVKKYGPTLNDVIETGRRSRAELDLIDGAGLDLRTLAAREESAVRALRESASRLTELRVASASRLAKEVDAMLPELGMPDGRFEVRLEALSEPTTTGAESVHFRVTLNLGTEPRPLARVASGGELSRVMLALKTILARLDRVPTLVFDEVDAGIGGTVGLRVGETMRRVAEYHQVFAITHLAQIAARAHQHIVVSKGAASGVTTADVRVTAGDDRVAEIARMLGGDPQSEASRAHARELLTVAAERQLRKPSERLRKKGRLSS